jgi:hypothetical protein
MSEKRKFTPPAKKGIKQLSIEDAFNKRRKKGGSLNLNEKRLLEKVDELESSPPNISPNQNLAQKNVDVSPKENLAVKVTSPPNISPKENLAVKIGSPPNISPKENLAAKTGSPPNISPKENLAQKTGSPPNKDVPKAQPKRARKPKTDKNNEEINPTERVNKCLDVVLEALLADGVVSARTPEVEAYVTSVCSLIRGTATNVAQYLPAAIHKTTKAYDPEAPRISVVQDNVESDDVPVVTLSGDESDGVQIVSIVTDSEAYKTLVNLFNNVRKEKLEKSLLCLNVRASNGTVKAFLEELVGAENKFEKAAELIAQTSKQSKIYAIMSTFSSMVYAAQLLVEVVAIEQNDGKSRGGDVLPIKDILRLVMLHETVDEDKYKTKTYKQYWTWLFPKGHGSARMRAIKTGFSALMIAAKVGLSSVLFPGDVYVMSVINKITPLDLRRVLLFQTSTADVKDAIDSCVLMLEKSGVLPKMRVLLPSLEIECDLLKHISDML